MSRKHRPIPDGDLLDEGKCPIVVLYPALWVAYRRMGGSCEIWELLAMGA